MNFLIFLLVLFALWIICVAIHSITQYGVFDFSRRRRTEISAVRANEEGGMELPPKVLDALLAGGATIERLSLKLQGLSNPTVGDLFWVQEGFGAHWGRGDEGAVPLSGFPVAQFEGTVVEASHDDPIHVYYRVDNSKLPSHLEWQSANDMPRWASRFTLRLDGFITDGAITHCLFTGIRKPIREML